MDTKKAEDLSYTRRNFRPLIELGRGGMARVYLAESLASGIRKLVVLKVLNRELALETEMRVAFQREAELSAQMNHTNVVQVFEVVEHAGTPVIVMEYLDGVSLSLILHHVKHTMPLRLHVHVLAQVLAGLHHFHELKDYAGESMNAVHRDVSPQNVIVLHDGLVKVVDFGIAKVNAPNHHTRTGMVKGKLHYMPPEQLLGEGSIDRRADIFAVGVMLWEALAGRRMWEGQNEGHVVRSLARGELPSIRDVVPDVSEELERIVNRALALDVNQRYATAEEMQLDLEQAISNLGKYVHPREISEFMSKNFGERRQFQRRAIERALRDPAASLSAVMECVTPRPADLANLESGSHPRGGLLDGDLSGVAGFAALEGLPELRSQSGSGSASGLSASLGRPATNPGTSSGAQIEVAPPARRRGWKVMLAILALGSAAGAGIAYQRSAAPPPAAAAAVDRKVMLDLRAEPSHAEIVLDGVSLGTGQYRAPRVAAQGHAQLAIRANGYVSEERTIDLSRDTTLSVQLQPEPQASATPAPSAAPEPQPATPEVAGPRRGRLARPARASKAATETPAPSAAPAAPAPAAAPNCNPPYKLAADGVKVFKPECF